MLTRKEVEELSRYRNEEFPITSLYLNVGKGGPEEGKTVIRLKNLRAQVEEERDRWTKQQMESVEGDMEQIRAFVRDQVMRGGQSLAAFACSAADFWQTYTFPRPVGNHIYLDHEPYVKPLLRLLEQYELYCTALVGKGKARIFLLHLDEIQERSDIFGAVPGRHDQGGWAQARLQRHHDDRVMRHLKTTADQIFDLFQEEGFARLLIGGTEELVSQFQEYLHPYLRERLVATFPTGMTASAKTVQERSLAIVREIEEREEGELLEKLENEVGAHRMGVSGLGPTLRALQRGQILTLLVNEGFSAPGKRCTGCGHLTVRAQEQCPYCGGELQPMDDMVDEIIDQAFAQGCQVRFIAGSNQERLARLGDIGALLRYTMMP
jgi:peptide chain release factor subunit 1